MQDVILVCRDHQLVDGQTHALGDVSGKHISEIACGNSKRHGAVRGPQGNSRKEVIHHLSQHTCPVDRVHPCQRHFIAKREIVEHVFDPRLAGIEISVNSQCMHVGFGRRGHLAALHLGHAAMRVKDEDIHRIKPAKRLDRGRSSVATGRPNNGDTLVPPAQFGLEQLADQLHGKIFECQRRPVKQFEQEVVLVQLLQRRAGIMAKSGICPLDTAAENIIAEPIAHKGAHHAKGNLLV